MSSLSKYVKVFRSMPFSTKGMLIIGAIAYIILFVLLLFGKYLTPYDANTFSKDILSPPSWKHLMGTDRLGRDTLSRVVVGTYWSLSIALISVAISLIIGTLLGAISGYMGGPIDNILTLIMDSLWVFPTFVLALVVSLVMGPGLLNTALAVAIVSIPVCFRIIRSQTLAVKGRTFIDAEKLINAKTLYIIRRHISPYYISSLLTLVSLRLSRAILAVCGLGFLGLGVTPPTPEWGTELAMGRFELLTGAWWLTTFPGLMIFVAIMGSNLLSEGLSKVLKQTTQTSS